MKYHFKTKPYSYQLRALNKISKLDGSAGLFMEMGTGKTKVAIDWAGIAYHNLGLKKVLVVCPLSVLQVWKKQIALHCPVRSRVTILDGPTTSRIHKIKWLTKNDDYDGITWVIINYEGVWRRNGRRSVDDFLINLAPDLVICDESHRIKAASSKQSRAVARIARFTKMKLALTGTPITKSPLDVFGQFRFIDDQIFGSNWYKFKNYYAIWGGFGRYQIKGYKHIQELVKKLRANTFRIKKDQALDLPDKVFLDVPVTLSAKAMDLYKRMAEDMIIEIENTHATAPIVLTKLLRLSQITSGFIKDIEGQIQTFDDSKLKVCLDLLEDILAEDQKVVIFVRFRHDIERLSTSLWERFKIHPAILSGSVPQELRNTLVEQFHEDPNSKVFIAQTQAGSLGIDLTPASIAIFYSLDYNAANYWQAQDRLHRIGQTRKVTYYHLIVPRTIDKITLDILKEKGDIAHTIIHDPTVLRQ